MNKLLRLIFIVLLLTNFFAGVNANAALECSDLFEKPAGIDSPSIKKWLQWEQTPSVPDLALTVLQSVVRSIMIPSNLLRARFAPDTPESLKNAIISQARNLTRWFQHPYNTNVFVPYQSGKYKSGPSLDVEHNASRTVTFEIDGNLYGLKMPTDHPFGEEGVAQPEKVDMQEDVMLARKRSEIIEQIDQELESDDVLVILKYVAVIKDKATKNGFVIRDLRPMQDGNYYLPAHQIPNIGREIAEANGGEEFYDYWKRHWAHQLGIAQARCLIRYGIESEYTNPQNYLIQLDKNLKPTGKIFYRDITDSNLNMAVAEAISLDKFVKFDKKKGIKVNKSIVGWKHNWSLAWKFETNPAGFDISKVEEWRHTHIWAYIDEIVRLLQLDASKKWTYEKLSTFLKSDEGALAIQRFHSTHKKLARTG